MDFQEKPDTIDKITIGALLLFIAFSIYNIIKFYIQNQ